MYSLNILSYLIQNVIIKYLLNYAIFTRTLQFSFTMLTVCSMLDQNTQLSSINPKIVLLTSICLFSKERDAKNTQAKEIGDNGKRIDDLNFYFSQTIYL